MNEAQRFIRCVLPGIASLMLFALYVFLSMPSKLDKLLTKQDVDTAGVLALLLGSGGLGYVLNIVHHFLYHTCAYRRLGLAVDFHPTLCQAQEEGKLEFADADGKVLDKEVVSNTGSIEAWALVTVAWHAGAKNQDAGAVDRTDKRLASLWDIFHASGAMLIGSLFAAIFGLYFYVWANVHTSGRFWVTGIIAIVVIVVMYANTRRLARMTGVAARGAFWAILDCLQDPPLRIRYCPDSEAALLINTAGAKGAARTLKSPRVGIFAL